MLLVLNLPLVGLWVRLLSIPQPWLYAGILVFATMGTIAAKPSVVELGMLTVFGIMGYLMRRFDYPIAACGGRHHSGAGGGGAIAPSPVHQPRRSLGPGAKPHFRNAPRYCGAGADRAVRPEGSQPVPRRGGLTSAPPSAAQMLVLTPPPSGGRGS